MPRIKQSDGAGKGHERRILGLIRQVTVDEAGLVVSMTEAEMVKRQYKKVVTSSAPSIPTSPTARGVLAGVSTTFTVTATGSTPLSYQWKKNGVNIPGATSASYTLSSPQTTDDGAVFACVVSNSYGSATSTPASLSVTAAPPVITSQPVNRSVTAGGATSFSVSVTGTAPLSFQWRKNGVDIAGATSATYVPSTAPTENGAIFACTISNAAGTVSTNNVTLTVAYTPVSISAQPSNITAIVPATAAFSVMGNGTNIGYQWRKNGGNIAGATSTTYTTPATAQTDDGAVYDCVVSNAWESITSNPVTLTVTTLTVGTPTKSPSQSTYNIGDAITLSVTVTSLPAGSLTYQWYRNGVLLSGATGSTYAFNVAGADSGATFTVAVSNGRASKTSASSAAITLGATQLNGFSPADYYGYRYSWEFDPLAITALGQNVTSYQWTIGGSAISGATANVLSTASVPFAWNGRVLGVNYSGPSGSGSGTTGTVYVGRRSQLSGEHASAATAQGTASSGQFNAWTDGVAGKEAWRAFNGVAGDYWEPATNGWSGTEFLRYLLSSNTPYLTGFTIKTVNVTRIWFHLLHSEGPMRGSSRFRLACRPRSTSSHRIRPRRHCRRGSSRTRAMALQSRAWTSTGRRSASIRRSPRSASSSCAAADAIPTLLPLRYLRG